VTSLAFDSSTDVSWSTRRSRALLLAIHVPFLLVAPLATATGLEDPPQNGWLVAALTVAIAALALRHSFAAANGVLPELWPATFAALGLLVFVPLPTFGSDWISIQWMFIASAALLLTGWPRLVFAVAPILGSAVWMLVRSISLHGTIATNIYVFVYWLVGLTAGAVCLYGAAQLVRAVDKLFATRAELAEATVGRERGRLSRDLHDLLGQSLSAVSLKGDLALALLRGGSRVEAEQEIRSLTALARETLRDTRHVVRDQHPVSLRAEIQRAGALLAAAGVEATIDAGVEKLPRQVDELLGWTTREGVTNLLRHSQAASCTVTAARRGASVMLEVINDGAGPPGEPGTGIAGLRERAQALSGSVTAGYLGDRRFRLAVQVPETQGTK
jgi:two-component system, NarL family, sensor histidine kinase DesK